MTVAVPPAFSIFSLALLLNAFASTSSFLSSSPLPSTLRTSKRPRTRRASRRASSFTVAPASKRERSATLTVTTFFVNGFVKPNFGSRR